MEEIRKDIVGFEGKYQISNKGNVRCLNFHRQGFVKNLKGSISTNGYRFFRLSKGGKYKNKNGHRIVAETFIPNPYCKSQVNHKNGIKTDNRVENLERVTGSENKIHAINELGIIIKGAPGKAVSKYSSDGSFICSYQSTKDASIEVGCHSSNIQKAAVNANNQKYAKGFIRKYE